MSRPSICNSIHAVILVGISAAAGCSGSDDVSITKPAEPAKLGSQTDPPPPRPETKEQCDACGGLWAVHGIEPAESCICKTSDADKRCYDGRDCQGQCLVDKEIGFQVTNPSDPPRGFFTGTCSPYDTTFGCHFLIPPGTSDQLPLPAWEAVQQMCID